MTEERGPRYQYQVLVDGTPMAHGPFDPTSVHHPRSMAATYQAINPESVVTIEYRDNEGAAVWTLAEPFDEALERVEQHLAKALLKFAAYGSMPNTFWHSDSRIALACEVLGWTTYQAQEWAEEWDPTDG